MNDSKANGCNQNDAIFRVPKENIINSEFMFKQYNFQILRQNKTFSNKQKQFVPAFRLTRKSGPWA